MTTPWVCSLPADSPRLISPSVYFFNNRTVSFITFVNRCLGWEKLLFSIPFCSGRQWHPVDSGGGQGRVGSEHKGVVAGAPIPWFSASLSVKRGTTQGPPRLLQKSKLCAKSSYSAQGRGAPVLPTSRDPGERLQVWRRWRSTSDHMALHPSRTGKAVSPLCPPLPGLSKCTGQAPMCPGVLRGDMG